MSNEYAIAAKLNMPYNQERILNILERGNKMGFSYYFTDFDEADPLRLKPATIQSALVAIIEGFPDAAMHNITARYEDTFIITHFIQDNFLTVMFYDFQYPWLISESEYIVDLNRYVCLMLTLIEPYEWIEFTVKKETYR